MEFGDLVSLAAPAALARSIFINEKRLSPCLATLARCWLACLIIFPTGVAATELVLGIVHRDHSKCPARLESWLIVDGVVGIVWVSLSLVDLAFVHRKITAIAGDSDGMDRTSRSELLGTWAALGLVTVVAIPLLRLLLLLWGVRALSQAHPQALDLTRPLPSNESSWGGCAPDMAVFMLYYFFVAAGVMCIVVVVLLALGLYFAVRTCCPPRRARRPDADPEEVEPLSTKSASDKRA